ncbi:alpha-ketoglutarate-dependent dioxygenase AlkB [Kitasatospora arboriphila]
MIDDRPYPSAGNGRMSVGRASLRPCPRTGGVRRGRRARAGAGGRLAGRAGLRRAAGEDRRRALVGAAAAAGAALRPPVRLRPRGLAAGLAAEPAPPLPDWALALAARLLDEGRLDAPAEQVIVNEYLPGQGISAHVDCVPCFGPVVAALSLGSAAVMDFTDPAGGRRVPVPLAPGGLTVLTGPARYAWRHAIPARRSDPGPDGRVPRGRRVSVTFRTLAQRPG